MLAKANNFHFLSFTILLTLLCLSCNDDDSSLEETIVESANANGWISHVGLETHYGEFSIINTNEYLIAGLDYIVSIDANGSVVEEIQDPFPTSTVDLNENDLKVKTKIFNEKIYRFTGIDKTSEDSERNIVLDIYEKSGVLIESIMLDARFTLIDVIIESDKMTLLTRNRNDPNSTGTRPHVFQVDSNGQLLFENNLASFPNIFGDVSGLTLLKDGNFLFSHNRTLYKVGNKFEPISSITTTNRIHHFIEGSDGSVYVSGVIEGNVNYITKLDKDLNQIKEIDFNSELISPIHPALTFYVITSMIVHEGTLYTLEVAVEYGQELRLQCFDLDFNKTNEFIVEGSAPFSDLIINELGSVSFLYGNPYAPFEVFPSLEHPTEARLFKLDKSCQLPEEVINN